MYVNDLNPNQLDQSKYTVNVFMAPVERTVATWLLFAKRGGDARKPFGCFHRILAALRRIRYIPPFDRDKYAYRHASQLFACRLITLPTERSEGRSATNAASRHNIIASSGKRRPR